MSDITEVAAVVGDLVVLEDPQLFRFVDPGEQPSHDHVDGEPHAFMFEAIDIETVSHDVVDDVTLWALAQPPEIQWHDVADKPHAFALSQIAETVTFIRPDPIYATVSIYREYEAGLSFSQEFAAEVFDQPEP